MEISINFMKQTTKITSSEKYMTAATNILKKTKDMFTVPTNNFMAMKKTKSIMIMITISAIAIVPVLMATQPIAISPVNIVMMTIIATAAPVNRASVEENSMLPFTLLYLCN